jgi:hypothetical protein
MLAGMTDSPIFALVDAHVHLWVTGAIRLLRRNKRAPAVQDYDLAVAKLLAIEVIVAATGGNQKDKGLRH